ncbi:NAD(P)-dependent oxidoreductase [Alicyclobacillus sp.]|uniref:NAD(P)-dependent oxidoreductase n=1 Tax=Alicyclobacillus sp. TaxID=61169 RepID=UPI0025C386D2|nr:NAD(P)-dependent oxidoreductase [Alicyclobacillus sp.]MCL6516562.1 NAD(P)-dependent oxidoreductase [Alicyclobacillus sp.]
MTMRVGFVGLGAMGAPMASRMARAGFEVLAYNRTRREVAVDPARVVARLDDAVADADVVCLMVSDAEAVESVLFDQGAAQRMRRGAVLVNFSTIGVSETERFALRMADLGVEWVDAPVSGSVQPAREGKLVVLAGGSEAAVRRVRPLLDAVARSVHHLGPVGSGAAMKLLVNGYLALVVAGASECLAMADKLGLGRERLLAVLSETSTWSPVLGGKREMWERDEFPASFALKHMAKDLNLLRTLAHERTAALPLAAAAHTLYLASCAHGLADADMAAVFRQLAETVGSR